MSEEEQRQRSADLNEGVRNIQADRDKAIVLQLSSLLLSCLQFAGKTTIKNNLLEGLPDDVFSTKTWSAHDLS